MRKILFQILVLLWKVIRQVFWAWLKPMIGRMVLFALLAIGLVVAVVLLIFR